MDAVEAARSATLETRAMLEDYYGGPGVLRDSWLVDHRRKDHNFGLEDLRDKFARAIVWQDSFVVAAIGSSVTSGSRNCHYDTYLEQLRRTLGPLLEAAGARLEVRNAGQGGGCGDTYHNQVWCVRTLVGRDVDIVHYSWTYFEVGQKDPPQFHEMFYRWTLSMEGAPIPQLLYTTDCSRLSQADHSLLDTYAGYGVNVLCMERGLRKVGFPGREWGVVGDTLHETTRYGEHLPEDTPRRRSLGVVFRDWHPGPLLFQLTADALTYSYTDALLMALDAIALEPNPRSRWPNDRAARAPARLPEPQVCDAEFCDVEEPPHCLTYQKPTFGKSGIRRTASDEGWSEWVAAPVYDMPEAERALPECAHLDSCAGLVAQPGEDAGWLQFEVPKLEAGFVAVCCSHRACGERLIESGAEFRWNGVGEGLSTEVLWGGKCVRLNGVSAELPQTNEAADGESNVLGIRIPPLHRPLPAISHVIGL